MAWQCEHSAESDASPADVWGRYVDVENWSQWSQNGVEWSRIEGPFEVGSEGKSKAPGFPAAKFRLVAVDAEERFVSQVSFPGARLTFEHLTEARDGGSRITHRATLDGPLSFFYAPLVRRGIERGLPDGVDRLAALAAEERGSDGERSADSATG